ncbi:DUF4132 domain-containing protein [Gilliamella apicola]|uniref:DUF4132 domain-containing protein n=1 Tax=Gilliamella apicola TaxID=1196095 RepID=UPI0039872194
MKTTEQLSTSPHKSRHLISTIFGRLSNFDESFPKRITQYILYGDELDVLTDFDKLCQIPDNANEIYQLLRSLYGYHDSWDKYELKSYASTQGCIDFYKLLTDVYTPEQIIRFDRFFAILCEHLGFIKHIDKQIPSWFIYLLYDGLLITIFNPLSELDKSLPERITKYILYGDEHDVLDDFDKLCQIPDNANDIYDLLRRPSDYYSTWDEFEPKTHPSKKARIDFYNFWMDVYTPEQIIRFARVLAILCDHLDFIKHISKQTPSWFIYLLYDGLITQLPPYYEEYCIHGIYLRKSWSVHKLHQLLEIEQEGLGDKLLFAIFDRKYITFIAVDRYQFFGYFTQLDGLLSYIQERIELFKQLPSLGLAPLGQIEQLKYIQRYPKLQLQLVDFIAMQALNSFKPVNQLATKMLFNLPHELIQPQLQHFLTSGEAKERAHAAILLSRIILEPTILLQALANERDETVIATIKIALLKLETSNTVKQQANLIIPDFEPLVDTPLPITARDILQQNFNEHLIECKKLMENELAENRENNTSWDYEKNRYKLLQTVTSKSLDIIFDYLNGKIDYSTLFKKLDKKIDFSFLATKDRLANLPEFSLYHLFRMTLLIKDRHDCLYFQNVYAKYDIVKNFDLRQVADVLLKINIIKDVKHQIARLFLSSDYFHNIYENEPYKLWAFFAENEFLIDEALGLAPQQTSYFINKAYPIEILQMFPTIPAKYVAYLFELALNESKYTQEQPYFILRLIPDIDNQVRYAAQDTLRQLPNIHIQVEQALSSPKQKVRIAAANWLAELGQKSSINALNAVLKNEKCETVQAAILVALEKMGEDISQHLTTKKLLADAQQGLKGKIPTGLDWFDFNLIPTLTWQNGDKVDSQIIEWWICLAFKLKDPINPLLTIYNRLLSTQSQQQLGEFILHSFINQDTRTPTLKEAEAKASSEADKRLQQRILNYQRYPEFYSDYKDITYEQVFEEIKNETLTTYLGSAIKAKGILALICGIEESVAVSLLISRFYQAMCAERQWRVEDWLKYLQPHPIVGRLIQRLVWLELDNNGQIVNSFRPTEDGSLITNQDDEILLDQNHFITIAHSALISSDDTAKWQAHLKDYKVNPLFEQFGALLPDMSKFKDGIIDDRLGWLMDSFTLRDVLKKLGYERDNAEDGGYFYSYYKYFDTLNIYINIEFSGSMLPEENIPAVLYNLYFSNKKGFKDSAIALDKLPKVLLAEGYANYIAVADASNGFDPNWQNKVIWDT